MEHLTALGASVLLMLQFCGARRLQHPKPCGNGILPVVQPYARLGLKHMLFSRAVEYAFRLVIDKSPDCAVSQSC